ncbi:MAG: dioxygenase [Steroidobacteraceae bacterium]
MSTGGIATDPKPAGNIDFDVESITEAVLQQINGTPSPRLREIMDAAVRHVHAFAREINLSRDEWLTGINFLTAVGKTCTPEHQEFILLSDTTGLTTLMNLLQDQRGQDAATRASVLGPFYREQAPLLPLGDGVAKVTTGPEAVMYGQVRDPQGNPIANAEVHVWLADAEGQYDIQAHGPDVVDLRARFITDEAGRYWFRTTQPVGYSVPMGGPVGELIRATARAGMRPAHIHFLIRAAGYQPLVTSVYFQGDPYLETDAAFGVTRALVVEVLPPSDAAPIVDLPRIAYDFTLVTDGV